MSLKQMIKEDATKKGLKFSLDIRLFAEDESEPKEPEVPPADPEPTKTLTQEQVDAIVEKRLARERKKWDEDKQKEQNEADKLKKMNDVQKAEYKAQQREEELAKKEAELNRRELMTQAKVTLAEKGIPVDMADFLDYESAEKCNESIEKLAKSFDLSVQKNVNDNLKGGAPIKKFQQTAGTFTKEDIEKMTPEEINANWEKVSEAMKNRSIGTSATGTTCTVTPILRLGAGNPGTTPNDFF